MQIGKRSDRVLVIYAIGKPTGADFCNALALTAWGTRRRHSRDAGGRQALPTDFRVRVGFLTTNVYRNATTPVRAGPRMPRKRGNRSLGRFYTLSQPMLTSGRASGVITGCDNVGGRCHQKRMSWPMTHGYSIRCEYRK